MTKTPNHYCLNAENRQPPCPGEGINDYNVLCLGITVMVDIGFLRLSSSILDGKTVLLL